jgi:hypothetical protein
VYQSQLLCIGVCFERVLQSSVQAEFEGLGQAEKARKVRGWSAEVGVQVRLPRRGQSDRGVLGREVGEQFF